MQVFSVDCCIRGHHIYKDIWSPTAGEELACASENSNTKDPYAVAVTRDSTVVGHIPRNSRLLARYFTDAVDYRLHGDRHKAFLGRPTSRRIGGRVYHSFTCSVFFERERHTRALVLPVAGT